MEKRTLGRTGMEVTVLGFGGAEIGFENAGQERTAKLLNQALDAGLNVIDTAECYINSEELIGNAVAHRRKEFFLFSKCGHASGMDGGDWDPLMLERSIDRSLQRLRTDRLDLIQLHSCDELSLRRGDVIAVLEHARDAGKTRFIGYSGDGDAARYAVDCGRFDTLQTSINIADQAVLDATLPEAAKRNMGVIAKRPVANAAWRHGKRPDNSYHHAYFDRLEQLHYPFLSTPISTAVATALRFTLSQPGVHCAIVGTANPDRWRENADALQAGSLPSTDIAAIRTRWKQIAKADWGGEI